MTYTIYRNGPFYSFWKCFLLMLNPFNWHKTSKSWIKFNFKQYYRQKFSKFKNDYEEFQYFTEKYKKRISWIEKVPEFSKKNNIK